MKPKLQTAVIGLGSMGYGMAASLLRAGHIVHGIDIAEEPKARFLAEGGAPGELAEIADRLDAAVIVVLNSAQVENILFGADGLVQRLRKGALVMACATQAPDAARDQARRCEEAGLLYLDAPISGGSAKAASGALSIMASGSAEAFTAARPLLDATAETVFELGAEPGQGSAMKSVNQMLAGIHIAAMAEAVAYGISQGIPPDQFLAVIRKCAGTSWMLENRAPHIVEGDYTPHSAVDIWLKDLGIVLDTAKGAKIPAPITATALQQFIAASGQGLGREDDAAVVKVYARNAGLKLPGGH
ncbi:MAG: L-threonate dehydrogenase [Pseudomonadota bacterium]